MGHGFNGLSSREVVARALGRKRSSGTPDCQNMFNLII